MGFLYSIIVPVYNAEKYLKMCIESVLLQTYKSFELVLVDDGSLDSSGVICDAFAAKDNRVRVFHQNNGGQFSARKKGMEISSGQYIIFLDADDAIRNDCLETVNSYITKDNDIDILFHEASKCDDFSTPFIDFAFDNGQIFENKNKKYLYDIFINKTLLNSMWAKVYKADVIKNVVWDEQVILSVRNGEDLMQNLPIFTKAKKIAYYKDIMYYYNQNDGSVSCNYSPTLYTSERNIYSELKKYIVIWGLNSTLYENMVNVRFLKGVKETVVNAMLSDNKTLKCKILEICNDDLFRSIYKNTSVKAISVKSRLLLKLLYTKQVMFLILVLRIFRSK